MTDAAEGTARAPRSHVLTAALWMTGAVTAFSAMAVAGRAVSNRLDTFELMTWRSIVGLIIVVSIALIRRRTGDIHARKLGLHFIRNAAHFTGQNFWFWALTVIPLAQVFALEFTSPLWVALLSPLLLAERLTAVRGGAALAGFIGILIVARPDFAHPNPGTLAGAAAAICFAGTIVFTRLLTRTEPVFSILFWLTAMQAGMGLVTSIAKDGALTLPTAETAPWLVLIGCSGLLAHFCLTSALSIAPATIVIPFDFARLPVIAVIGMLFYHEPLDPWVFLGAAIILAANVVNVRVESRRN